MAKKKSKASTQKFLPIEEIRDSITILKDASAASIYGSRAANGVVVIETQEPEQGKLKISYRANTNIESTNCW